MVPPGSALRPACEALVRRNFARCYDAALLALPDRLVALVEDGRPLAVAGLRDRETGFFSQAYLDRPLAQVLSAVAGHTLAEADLIEITSLASERPGFLLPLLRAVVQVGRDEGRSAVLFTAVERLQHRLTRLHLPLLDLGPAEARRLPDHHRWGRYYEHRPRVMAVLDDPVLDRHLAPSAAAEPAVRHA